MKPMRPVPRGCGAGRFDGRYKVEPEDFVVEEVPAYEPCGEGQHVWIWVEKSGLSTLDLLKELGQKLGRHEKSFGIAGLKDARAISRQWISVDLGDEQACRALSGPGFRVKKVSRHGNKLRLGHSRGNRFEIVLRDCSPGALEIAQANLAELEQQGVPNYFGEQRFGKRGANLQKGLEALRGEARAMGRRMPRRVFGLVLSAVQSELFNRVVIKRLDRLGTILPGDLAQLHKNGAVFTVEDPAKEQPRADALELSPSGPMPGPDMMAPSGEPLELELAALAELELTGEEFHDLPFGLARGERRPLRCPIKNAAAKSHEHGVQVGFTLPKGCYATSVLRELLNDTIWFAQDRRR
ncbi:MAG: tRNA pseudouridine(13) synthase TruD [Planctomycetes bacterium]|nr:tRNA pseudouridine(13) synthase TruD [Planctomycetota bacterium]